MNSTQVVDAVTAQVQSAKDRGHQEVTIESLETYLEALKQHIESQAPLMQANIDFQRQANEYAHQSEQEMFRSVIVSGQIALKTSLLIGGGGAAALLAFASSAWKSLKPEGLELLGLTVFLLGVGVLLVGIAAGTTYLSQSFYHDGLGKPDKCLEDKIADRLRVAACAFVVLSYLVYGWSCWNIFRMMKSFSIEAFIPVS
ncbi:hypothetical protein [Pseudomonas mandelii]|uniref:Uncharacterized protein n=2 Tax=Pseudomonas fluorescens group TaxID=136843 RepID=A0ABY0VG48_9PSED|nr:hypothetical protein [Pseudomonas mandelii]TWS12162.1 hypothetical protein FJD35_00930 [Pseudomonas mandelii]SDU20302.1 hypothetical protein SAMN04489801_1482 [Pseudomonas mandelii]